MFRRIALSTVLGAGLALAPLSSAFAHDHWHRGGPGAGVVAAAVLGTVAVLGAATALASPPVVVAPAPVYVAPPAVVYPAPAYAYSPYYGYYRVR